MTKRVVLLGVISALILSGCGKAAGTQVARPIALGSQATKPATTTPAQALTRVTPAPSATPLIEAETETELETETEEETPETEASASPTPTPSPSASASASPTPTPTPTPSATPTPVAVEANKFVKSIGNGSLNSSHGVAVDGTFLYVVDNARTGLFGKFAAVRQYNIASGAYTKLSFENLGMAGAKNMPTTVTAVKLVDGNVVASSATAIYTFDLTAKLLSSGTEPFALTTSVVDPKTGDTFKINGAKIDRVHAGAVVASFGDDVIGEGNAIAVGTDGSLFVSDKTKGIVHQFAPATK